MSIFSKYLIAEMATVYDGEHAQQIRENIDFSEVQPSMIDMGFYALVMIFGIAILTTAFKSHKRSSMPFAVALVFLLVAVSVAYAFILSPILHQSISGMQL